MKKKNFNSSEITETSTPSNAGNGKFFPDDKYARKNAQGMITSANLKKFNKKPFGLVGKTATPNLIATLAYKLDEMRLKKMLAPRKKQKPARLVLKCLALLLATGVAGYLVYNEISASIYNGSTPTKDPHTTEDVINPNDNDFTIDDSGQIDLDQITEEEAETLVNNFYDLLRQDALSRSDYDIGEVNDISSISLLPSNLFGENELDKYILSIIFSNENKEQFSLNYLTGKDFSSSAETTKDIFADFINFLSYDCALDTCFKVDNYATEIKDILGQNAKFVGETYLGYKESGDECYFIPVYYENGEGNVYCTQTSTIDAYELVPEEELLNFLSNKKNENQLLDITFTQIPFEKSQALQQICQILRERLQPLLPNIETEAKTEI